MKKVIILLGSILLASCMSFSSTPPGILTYEKIDGKWQLKYYTVTLEKQTIIGTQDDAIRETQENVKAATEALNKYLEGK